MSRKERTVRINISKNEDESGSEEEEPKPFNAMQKNMEDELEKRRTDWEKEVETMQQDFFKTKLNPVNGTESKSTTKETISSPHGHGGGGYTVPVKKASSSVGAEIFDIMNSKSLYSELPDGTRVYRVRFDVKDFEPDEIHVKAEGKKLTVKAKHQEGSESGNKTTKQFNRSVDLPDGVDPDELMSYLSGEGILTVEAPVEEVEVERNAPEPLMEYERHLEYDMPPQVEHHGYSSDYSSPLHSQHMMPPEYNSRLGNSRHVNSRHVDSRHGDSRHGDSRQGHVSSHVSIPFSLGPMTDRRVISSGGPVTEKRVISSSYGTPMHQSRGFVPADTQVELNHWGFSSGGNRVCQSSPQSTRIWRTTRNDTPLVTQTRKHMQHNYPTIVNDNDVSTTRTYTSSRNSSSPRSMSPARSPRLNVRGTTNTPEVEDTEYGKKVRLVIDIGKDYDAEDITVALNFRKVSVTAVHEDKTGGRSSKRQFSRDYDLPCDVEGRTVRATLSADNKLHIGASAKGNEEHDVIIGFIIQDMPRGGSKCKVEF
eukprot:GHVU01137076.1.p1 GENE.GHVU01137076.1~~GHVU01137076.1.p1  ORF type:complete len:538 (+),score=67.27 GHVU01137076.1:80-1693(+)